MVDSYEDADDSEHDLFRPRTMSYSEAVLRGAMSEEDIEAIREDLLGMIRSVHDETTAPVEGLAGPSPIEPTRPMPRIPGRFDLGLPEEEDDPATRVYLPPPSADDDASQTYARAVRREEADADELTWVREEEVKVEPRARGGPSVSMDELAEHLRANDYESALRAAEAILAIQPSNVAARKLAEFSREMLVRSYFDKVGGVTHVPRIVAGSKMLEQQALDRSQGFVLAMIDGESTIEEIIDVSGLSRYDTMSVLYDLTLRGIISIRPPEIRKSKRPPR